jgi:hypothetical protein
MLALRSARSVRVHPADAAAGAPVPQATHPRDTGMGVERIGALIMTLAQRRTPGTARCRERSVIIPPPSQSPLLRGAAALRRHAQRQPPILSLCEIF